MGVRKILHDPVALAGSKVKVRGPKIVQNQSCSKSPDKLPGVFGFLIRPLKDDHSGSKVIFSYIFMINLLLTTAQAA